MRKRSWCVAIGLVAFVVGVLAVTVDNVWTAPAVFVVARLSGSRTTIPRFTPTYRGCGNGYVQGYDTDDGQRVDEGVEAPFHPKQARTEFLKYIREAKQVIKRLPKYHDHLGKVGERVVIVNKPDREGNRWVSILFYDGGHQIRYIDAPNLGLALEFEQYLIREDPRNKQ